MKKHKEESDVEETPSKGGLKPGHYVLIGLGIFVILVLLWVAGAYNGLVRADENVNEKWGNVQADYQRRFDLIPNLVSTVKTYTNYEGDLLTKITEARSAWANAKTIDNKMAAANNMESAFARLMVVVENYPNLKANENFLSLQDELAGTENRIKQSRVAFNEAIKAYNVRVRVFPTSIIARMFGFGTKTMFEAAAGSEQAPDVGEIFNA
ncbi:MAG: LemA family protein [Nanoarchaeota archaeon]|nr:LemA family protein [Nanoarchaeota archaeon]